MTLEPPEGTDAPAALPGAGGVDAFAVQPAPEPALETAPEPALEPAPAAAPPVRKKRGMLVLAIVLGVVLVGAIAAGVWLFLQLSDAQARIEQQQDKITEQKDEILEQRELIEKKEVFGAAMNRLHDTIAPLAGLPFTTLVPWNEYDALASRAWANRRNADGLDRMIEEADEATAKLAARQESARVQLAGNATGTAWETTLDQLGAGWVATSIEDVSVLCDGGPLACVLEVDPYIVHIDAGHDAAESMNDWIRAGVAYHELAHVLQFTNPDPTATALVAFGGDHETMADCYALTFLDGWSLDHEVWINSYEYWEVSVGYGYTCNDGQRQVIRDWASQLAIQLRPIGG